MSSNHPNSDIDFDRDSSPSPFVPPPAEEAEYQAFLDEQESRYEESVRASYAARGLSNLY